MRDVQAVIELIQQAFGTSEFPGLAFLQGSFEGDEPEEEVGPFRDQPNWQTLAPDFLDAHAAALSFFSEAGFRFFLPAYLIADLKEQTQVADPVFHLTHGFYEVSVNAPVGDRVFVLKSGKTGLINPRRYGAATSGDYARYRLSVFTREEAAAIVAYLEFRRDSDPLGLDKPRIQAALDDFWFDRAQHAPTAEILQQHLAEQKEYIDAIQAQARNNGKH